MEVLFSSYDMDSFAAASLKSCVLRNITLSWDSFSDDLIQKQCDLC